MVNESTERLSRRTVTPIRANVSISLNRGSIIRGMFRKNNEISPQPERERSLDRAGRSLLHHAAGEHDVNHVKELIRQGEDVNLADRQGWTPLHFAAQSYDAEMADLLLDSGALVDHRDSYGNTPLSTAVFNSRGRGELIGLLRKRGANPTSKNNSGVSPTSLARTIANYNVALFFLDVEEE